MGFRLFSRRTAKKQSTLVPPARAKFMESLEGRTLFAGGPVAVTWILADNRGQVQMKVNKALAPNTVNKKSFRLFIQGPDGILNTSDDIQVPPSSVKFDATAKIMTLVATVPADTNYRVKVYSSGIIDIDGLHLDGEYTGSYPTGNGVESGDLIFRTKRDSSNTPVARVTTSYTGPNGNVFNVKLNKTAAPETVANFLFYANSGRYDKSIIHRNSKSESPTGIQVLQGGNFYSNGSTVRDTNVPAIPLETGQPGQSNILGSLAMARAGDNGDINQTNTATTSFFINITNNASSLDPSDGSNGFSPFGYAVFGNITSGVGAVNDIYKLQTSSIGGGFFAPIVNGNFVSFSRVAILTKIATV